MNYYGCSDLLSEGFSGWRRPLANNLYGGTPKSGEGVVRRNGCPKPGFLKRALAQTCLRAWHQVPFLEVFLGILGTLYRGRGRPWYGTSAQPESHATCSSSRRAPWVVPSTFLLNVVWAFLGGLGRERGHRWYGTFAKPTGHFTEGMFEKC